MPVRPPRDGKLLGTPLIMAQDRDAGVDLERLTLLLADPDGRDGSGRVQR
jgi:hypothetical protein